MMMGRDTVAGMVHTDAAPRAQDGRILISTRGILEWAFGVECASLDHNEVGEVGPNGFSHRSATANICDMLALGDAQKDPGRGVRVDEFGGRSFAHDDAELVATTVRNALDWQSALRVAELARTGRAPVWDLGLPAIVPKGQPRGRYAGARAATEVIGRVTYRSRRGLVTRDVLWCPVSVVPSDNDLLCVRRAYLAWLDALLAVRAALPVDDLIRFHVTSAMPVVCPWQKNC